MALITSWISCHGMFWHNLIIKWSSAVEIAVTFPILQTSCLVQMLGVTLLLYGLKAASTDLAEKAIGFGVPLLGVATLITLGSLADYFRKLWVAL